MTIKKKRTRKIKTPGVYLDTNGTYYLKYKNKTYRGFKTIGDAELHKATLRLTKDNIHSVKLSVVIQDFLNDQKSKVKAQEVSYGTYDKKKSALSHYVTDALGDYKISKLTPKMLREFRNDMIDLDISTVHKNYILQTLKSVFKYAMKYNELKDDLAIYLERFPKTSDERIKDKNRLSYIWTLDDFNKFIDGMDIQFKLAFTLMFLHGLRRGEVQALRYCDVNSSEQTIDINGSITKKTEKGTFERKSTKTDNSSRKIFIGETINYIIQLKEVNEKLYGFNDYWYVCGNKVPLTDRQIDRKREKHIKDKNLVSCTNHEMRHMFVTNTWSAGVPINAISHYIGHKNVSITLDTYSHLTKADDDKMVEYISSKY